MFVKFLEHSKCYINVNYRYPRGDTREYRLSLRLRTLVCADVAPVTSTVTLCL